MSRSRTRIIAGAVAVVGITLVAVVVYRERTVGNAEVRDITERVAAAMATGNRAALSAEPALQSHQATVNWLLSKGPVLAGGYRVYVQRNGENGLSLLDSNTISHIGVIEVPAGRVTLGFWRDPESGVLTYVTSASTLMVSPAAPETPGEIPQGNEGAGK